MVVVFGIFVVIVFVIVVVVDVVSVLLVTVVIVDIAQSPSRSLSTESKLANGITVLIMFPNRNYIATRSSVITGRSNIYHHHVSGFQQQHRLQKIRFLLGPSPNILLGPKCHDWSHHISLQRSGYLYNTQT